MKKEPNVYLLDILGAIERIEQYIDGISYTDFEKDTQKQDAVIRRFEIIGEASRRLEDDFRSTYDMIPWTQLVDFRNVLIHQYDEIDLRIIWKVLQDGELDELKIALANIMKDMEINHDTR